MAQVMLEPPRIHALAGQCVASAVAQHVDVNRERQFGSFARALDHAANAHAAERLASLVHEQISCHGFLLTL